VIDRLLKAVKNLVEDMTVAMDTHAMYPGTVVSQASSGEVDVKLDTQRFGAGLSHLTIQHGVPGMTVKVPAGTRVLVGFTNGNRGQPVAFLWPAGSSKPTEVQFEGVTIKVKGTTLIELNPTGAMGVARMGDTVVAGPFGGTITTASLTVKAGA
jgi:hypothetical protein